MVELKIDTERMEEDLPKVKPNNVKTKKEPAEPPSKRQELNIHIVCMRNSVRQAKVQIINRLISQIKKYKNRKGSPKDQEKAKRKADRILEEIQILKKIKKDKVSLYALQDTLHLDAVLSNLQSSSEERVLARLSNHPVIVKHVKQYRDANPNWDKQIPVLLEMTREKRRKKKENPETLGETPLVSKKTEKKKAVVKEKEVVEDSTEEDNTEEDDDDHIEEDDEAESSDVDEEESEAEDDLEEEEDEDEEEETEVPIKKSVAVNKSKAKPALKKAEGKPNSFKLSPVKNDKKSTSALQIPSINKSEGTVKVQFLTDLHELEEEEIAPVKIDITQAPKVKKPKSGFFVGGVDLPEEESEGEKGNSRRKDFQNSAPFNKSQNYNNGQGQSQSKPVYKKGKLISKPPPRNNPRSQGRDFNPQQNRPERPFANNKRFGGNAEPLGVKKPRFSGGDPEEIFERPLISGAPATATPAEKLHPSWEAKKKQQQMSLTEFKGKKIVFGDDD